MAPRQPRYTAWQREQGVRCELSWSRPFWSSALQVIIYAWGFRNPFRISFDRSGNGDLFVSGIAESFWETIYLVHGPGNFGWAIREGTH